MTLPAEPIPGKFNHVARECKVCGVDQSPFVRPVGTRDEPFRCTTCGSPEGAQPKTNGHGVIAVAPSACPVCIEVAPRVAVLERELTASRAEVVRLRDALRTIEAAVKLAAGENGS